jgi:hypothetical protein
MEEEKVTAIGDLKWVPNWDQKISYEKCPCCGGSRAILITTATEEFSVECETCKLGGGYTRAAGSIEVWTREPRAIQARVVEIHTTAEGTKFRTQPYADNWFDTEAEALTFAQAKVEEFEKTEREGYMRKVKDKSWAWHVTYHKECLARAERDIVYHTDALFYARGLAKEEKKEVK